MLLLAEPVFGLAERNILFRWNEGWAWLLYLTQGWGRAAGVVAGRGRLALH
jgi:hypothetical protein